MGSFIHNSWYMPTASFFEEIGWFVMDYLVRGTDGVVIRVSITFIDGDVKTLVICELV